MGRAPFQVLVLPWRRTGEALEYAVLRRTDTGYWQPAAGGGEDGETPEQAAQREAFEELGTPPDAPLLRLDTTESIRVTEFRASPRWGEQVYVIPQYCFGLEFSGEVRISHEHVEIRWLPFNEAERLLRFDGNRTALWELDRRLRGRGPRGEEEGRQEMLRRDPAQRLVFLKLGGSLITDKARPHTLRAETLARLAAEIAAARSEHSELRLLLGHGSGSFGHVPAKRHGTRQGVRTAAQWQGFVEVWREAAALNHLVMAALAEAGLPAVAFPPSAMLLAEDGKALLWNLEPLKNALEAGLLPVVYGDVVFDRRRGGTIFSTEDLFAHLAGELHPQQLLMAGIEAGVWADYPVCQQRIERITPATLSEVLPALGGSAATDVTGGMAAKVLETLHLVEAGDELQAAIFSGDQPGLVQRALATPAAGILPGTVLARR